MMGEAYSTSRALKTPSVMDLDLVLSLFQTIRQLFHRSIYIHTVVFLNLHPSFLLGSSPSSLAVSERMIAISQLLSFF